MKLKTFKAESHPDLNEAYNKVMNYFFAFPDKEIGLNDLIAITRISKTTANRIARKLEKEGFLKIEVFGNMWRISCNHNHKYNHTLKISYNLNLLHLSGITDKIAEDFPEAKALILFGSYSKGDDTESSDLDIAAEILGEKDTRPFEFATLPKLGYRKDVKVNILFFTRKKVDRNLFANIANGIVLRGFLEAKP